MGNGLTCTACHRKGSNVAAEWNVWPDAQSTGYDYLCTTHVIEALRLGMEVGAPYGNADGNSYARSPVYQITKIRK
jgi:hypothetical protein